MVEDIKEAFSRYGQGLSLPRRSLFRIPDGLLEGIIPIEYPTFGKLIA